MSDRVCPECGTDTWKAAAYDDLREAKGRADAELRKQAVTILELRLEVARLADTHPRLQTKVERQRRVIRRLEDKLRALSAFPHEGAKLDDVEPVEQSLSPQEPGEDDALVVSHGLRLARGARRRALGAEDTP